jgi:demethylmenaquinone methyltransferase/2-methoxy-6-polyprenyl-1,4-benzoquinol methylase
MDESPGRDQSVRVAPHPPLSQYYGEAEARPAFVRDLFDRTAADYDRIGQLLSLGCGGWYRRRALRRAGLAPGMRLLDVAVGTGAVAHEAAAIIGEANIIGIDISQEMLAVARRRLGIFLVRGAMERLPIADASVDFLSMGYALRHVSDLAAAFREFHRVLRPGGTLLLLELAQPASWQGGLVRFYLGKVIPRLSRWTTGSAAAETLMRYYWDTIAQCVAKEAILAAMAAAGLTGTRCDDEFGVFRMFLARRSPVNQIAATDC